MLNHIKSYSKFYTYALIILAVSLRIFLWNTGYEKEFSKAEKFTACVITCKIISVPEKGSSYTTFNAKITDGADITEAVRISVSNSEKTYFYCGDTVKLTIEPIVPNDEMNPGNFSYKRYLKSQGVCAAMKSDVIKVESVKHEKYYKFYKVRNEIIDNFFKYMPYNEASLATALITGNKKFLPDSAKNDFKKAGVYHVVAVSGLHLSIFILFMSYLYRRIRINIYVKRCIVFATNIVCTVFLFLFTGFGVSVERAALMTVILSLASLADREYSPGCSLAAAAVFIFIYKPYTFFDVSCRLSFLATAGIITGVFIIEKYELSEIKFHAIAESLILTVGAWIFTLPVSAYEFGGISLISFVSNLTIVALAPFALCFSYIFSVICLLMPEFICCAVAGAAAAPLNLLIKLSSFFANIPGAYVNVYPRMLYTLSINALILPTILFIIKHRYKVLCTVTLSGIITVNVCLAVSGLHAGSCKVSFVNVGQGDCAVVKTPQNQVIMIDCGSETQKQVAQNNVIPYLNRVNIAKINAVILTHYHDDHANGITQLIESGRVQKLYLPDCRIAEDEEELATTIVTKAVTADIPIEFISRGDKIKADKYSEFKILNPDKRLISDTNDKSVVAMLKCYNSRVLFTGDIGNETQYRLMKYDIKTDILKVPHHGGKSELSPLFAKNCKPEYAVISCGINNMYKHPHEHTLNAYKGSVIYRTDKDKLITFIINKNSVISKNERNN